MLCGLFVRRAFFAILGINMADCILLHFVLDIINNIMIDIVIYSANYLY